MFVYLSRYFNAICYVSYIRKFYFSPLTEHKRIFYILLKVTHRVTAKCWQMFSEENLPINKKTSSLEQIFYWKEILIIISSILEHNRYFSRINNVLFVHFFQQQSCQWSPCMVEFLGRVWDWIWYVFWSFLTHSFLLLLPFHNSPNLCLHFICYISCPVCAEKCIFRVLQRCFHMGKKNKQGNQKNIIFITKICI